jgi:hypothetical protein
MITRYTQQLVRIKETIMKLFDKTSKTKKEKTMKTVTINKVKYQAMKITLIIVSIVTFAAVCTGIGYHYGKQHIVQRNAEVIKLAKQLSKSNQ